MRGDLGADARTLAHLLEFDSTYGRLGRTVAYGPDSITVDGVPMKVLSHQDPAAINGAELGVDLVIESTGKFRARDDATLYRKAGARKVLISAPGNGADLTVVVGVNQGDYDPGRHDVISAASCTTNCVVPMVKVLNDAFGLVKGLMTTIHAYTGDQMLLDGSLTDLTAVLHREVTAAQVNLAFEQAAAGGLAGVLHYSTDALVSRDIIGQPSSCLFDSGLTQAAGDLVKVFGWYDNEWGYTCRLVDLAALIAARL